MGFPHVFPVFHMVFHSTSQRNCRRLNAEYDTCALHSCRVLPTSPCRRSLFFAAFSHRNAGVPSVPSLRTYHLFVPLRASPSGHCPCSATEVSPRFGSSAAAPLRAPPCSIACPYLPHSSRVILCSDRVFPTSHRVFPTSHRVFHSPHSVFHGIFLLSTGFPQCFPHAGKRAAPK